MSTSNNTCKPGYKYLTDEQRLEVNKEKAMIRYINNKEECKEYGRKYSETYYQKHKAEILEKARVRYQQRKNIYSKNNIIVTPNFILEIIS